MAASAFTVPAITALPKVKIDRSLTPVPPAPTTGQIWPRGNP